MTDDGEKKYLFPGHKKSLTRAEWLSAPKDVTSPAQDKICSICGRSMPDKYAEKHHLIPKCKKGSITIDVCIDCGNQIHQIFTVKELTKIYNTLESLLAHPKIQEWKKWVQDKGFGICMKSKKRKK